MAPRRARVLLALAAFAAAFTFGSSQASAAIVCVPTDYSQDGQTLTAALVNPPDGVVPENLDATGCDIGIYYNDGKTHSLVDKNVFGSRYYGVLSRKEGTVTNLSKAAYYDIGEDPHDGTQHGVSVAYRDGADGTLDHSQVFDYQKGGVLANGAGTNVQVLNNLIRGLGPVSFIAQNGVQYSNGATGNVNDNVIQDHQYTGCSKQDQRNTGCSYVVSTGILLFNVDPKQVDTRNNTYRNNDVNLLNASNSP